MKKRLGFVTNSSSSSFIIGKKDDDKITIESVYQIIRNLYIELLEKRDKLIDHIKKNDEFEIEYVEGENWADFIFLNKSKDYKYKNEIRKKILDEFEIDIYYSFKSNDRYAWINMKTYEEYEKYWLSKQYAKNYASSCVAPFTITDYSSKKPVYWLHWIDKNGPSKLEVGVESEELGWYFPYLEDLIDNKIKDCETCKYKNWCDKDECNESKKAFDRITSCDDNLCLNLLGKICVHSESGYIDDFVVNKLKEISEFSCNHMG